MSIQSEITRIRDNVAAALTAISDKGVTVPVDATSDDLAALIAQIETGGGSVTWELMADQDVTVVTSSPNYFVINNYTTPFSADETYRVTWDGTEYICQTVAISSGTYDGYYIGNFALAVSGREDTGEPFFIYRDRATRIAAVTDHVAGTVHIKIERQAT